MKPNPIYDTASQVVEHSEAAKQNESDKHDHNPTSDLFPESLETVAQESNHAPRTPPVVSGQTAQVLNLIREHQPFLSFRGTADFAIPEFAARVHDLRAMGFDVRTRIEPKVIFRGRERRNAAFYSLGAPEFPAPGFLKNGGSI